MKKIPLIAIILTASLLENVLRAQNITFNRDSNGTNSIIVPAGESWKIISYSLYRSAEIYTNTNRTTRIGIIQSTGEIIYGADGIGGMGSGVVIVGPAVIWLGADNLAYYFAFEKKPSAGLTISQASTSVVIPNAATGDVDVKLEQSADNVTWTECLPGTYNSSTVKRFFRLRAVEK